MTAIRLTPARRRGLQVLAAKGGADISNRTDGSRVYWQTAGWLIDQGWVTATPDGMIRITDAGRDAVAYYLLGEEAGDG